MIDLTVVATTASAVALSSSLQRYSDDADGDSGRRPQPGVEEHELDLAPQLRVLLLALDVVHLGRSEGGAREKRI